MKQRKSRRYVIVSPCRDEAQYMRKTLDSIIAQTVAPTAWVIVDDGSTDDSPSILAEYAAQHAFITIVRRQDRGRRAVGPGVIEAFYAGLNRLGDLAEFDYVCKLDLDLEIPATYFERVLEEMESDPWLGNFSGKPYVRDDDGRLTSERMGDENAVGMIKFYRTAAFKEIGGFVREVSWDGIDGHMCRMKGWIARSEDREELRFTHLRRMGSSQQTLWSGRLRWGFGKYYMGSALYYVIAVALFRMFERPYVVGGLGILCGYLKAWLGRGPRFDSPGFRRFLRRYELRSLLFGKRRTADRHHEAIRRWRALQAPSPTHERQTILGVSSGGGHWVELLRLAPAFEGHELVLVTVDKAYRAEASGARFHTVRDVTRWDTWRGAQTVAKLIWIMLRERPDVVVSTGALPGYLALRLAKWFGARTIWLDSIANVEELSMSGREIARHADLWLTQWPHLAAPQGPIYRGTVL
jgi:biofilm PGA synthesis N-glycosyltransferase PgaC